MTDDDDQHSDKQARETGYCVARFGAVLEDLVREGVDAIAIEISLGEIVIRAACKDPVTAAGSLASTARLLDAAADAAYEWGTDGQADGSDGHHHHT
jgi:hypothetical protein